jgi:PAS domain-containing protein
MELPEIFRLIILMLAIGFFVVSFKLHKDYLNSQFHNLFIRLFFVLGIFFLLIHLIAASDSSDEAWIWTYFLVVAHLFYPIVNDSLVRLYGKKFLRKRNHRLLLLYFPFLVLIFLDLIWPEITIGDPKLTPFGWVYVNLTESPLFFIHQIIYFSNIGLMIFLILGILATKYDSETKTYVVFFVLTFLLPFVLYIITSFVFDADNKYIIPFTALGGSLSMIFILLFLTKYRVFNISPEIAAQDIVVNMPSMLFLLNKDFRIEKINHIVTKLLGFKESEILYRYFYDLIQLPDGEMIDFQELSGNEVDLISRSGVNIPVFMNIIPVIKKNHLHGYAIIGLDRSKTVKVPDKHQWIDLKIRFLQSEMNPHFLYNAIFSARDLIVKGDILSASEYLFKLGQMYKLILSCIKRNLIRVADEIKLLEYYLSLEKLHFNSGFSYEIKTAGDDSIVKLMIPPLLIQPFVENSIKHGFNKQFTSGGINRLLIKLDYSINKLTVTIDDNGSGRKKSKGILQDSEETSGTALANIRERIELINLKDDSLKINLHILDKLDSDSNANGTTIVLNFIWD